MVSNGGGIIQIYISKEKKILIEGKIEAAIGIIFK